MSKQPIGRFIVILGPQAYKDDFVERGLYKLHIEGTETFQRPPKKTQNRSKLKRKEI